MRRALVLAVLALAASPALSGQTLVGLQIRAVLTDASGRATPVARHALLISENPPTREPRRVVTTLDGSATVRLRPGNYTVESDQPVAFQGQAYRWNQRLDIVAGRDSTLELTLSNAVVEARAPGAAASTEAPPATDTSLLLRQRLDSVVEVWTPTAHASGFLIDAAGLIATSQRAVGDATSVEVQLSRSIKVAGTVLEADSKRDVAVIRIDPATMASIPPIPIVCGGSPPAIARGQEIFTLAAPLRQEKGWTPGTVSRVDARGVASDLRVATGGVGGPVFDAAGELVGITSPADERDEPRRGDVRVVRLDGACEVVAAAAKKAQGSAAPSGARLPVEPMEPAPIAAFKEAVKRRAGSLKPYQMAAADFDVGFITPILNYAAQQSLTNQTFSNWSDYMADVPPVLFIRATPTMTESLLSKVARGAAYTQGMALPALKRLTTGFDRMRALCGSAEVTPIHPFTLELRVSETESIDEGLYAFDPAAFGPECGTVTLVLYSEKQPDKADTRVVDPKLLEQIRRDFALGVNR